MKTSFTIGLDLGGTKLAAALLDQHGQIIDFQKVPVELRRESSVAQTQRRIIGLMGDLTCDFKKRFPKEVSSKYFKGIGLASAGPLNVERGELIFPANFPGWKKVPLVSLLEDEIRKRGFSKRIHFQHDATAAALAEGWIGAAQKMNTFAVVTIGTGIGTGIVFNGLPAQSRGMGSEYGHTIVDFSQIQQSPKEIKYGTVEGIASGLSLLRRARQRGFHGVSVEELVADKNPKYQSLYKDMALALGCLCHNLSIGYNLEKIFLSGGLIKIRNLYLDDLKAHYKDMIRQTNPAFECKIEIAKTKNKAGVIGAGYLPYLYSKRSR